MKPMPILIASLVLAVLAAPVAGQGWNGGHGGRGGERGGPSAGPGPRGFSGPHEERGPPQQGFRGPPQEQPFRGPPEPYGAPPPGSGWQGDSLGAGWGPQQDEVRQGVRQRRFVPLGRAIQSIRRRGPGHELDAGLEQWGGRPAYRVRWAAPNGHRIDYMVDAESGAILSADGGR